MKNKLTGDLIVSIAIVGVLVFFINPLDLLMPRMLHPYMLTFLVVLFVIFWGLTWREDKGDERQQMHKYMASRWAYFGTILVLVAGVVGQGFGGKIDPWLVIAICVGLLIKIAGLIYAMYKK